MKKRVSDIFQDVNFLTQPRRAGAYWTTRPESNVYSRILNLDSNPAAVRTFQPGNRRRLRLRSDLQPLDLVMDASAQSGFQSFQGGIHYWFLDGQGVASFLGPISLLEPLQPGEFLLKTTADHRYRIRATAEQIDTYRRLGGIMKAIPESGPTSRLRTRWGFQKSDSGVYLWLYGNDRVKYFGPIELLEHVSNDQYSFVTKGARHSIRLQPEKLAEFERLGGVVNAPQFDPAGIASDAMPAPVPVRGPLSAMTTQTSGGIPFLENRGPLRWCGIGQHVKFGSYRIADALTYFSNSRPADDDASCIDLTLPVGKPVVEPQGALGYWPEYRRMSPDQRASYLAWLAFGRDGRLDDIGYAFVYFYGLERRVLLENRDVNPVTCEVIRLLHRYSAFGSFAGYLSRFLVYVMARTGIEKLRQEWFDTIFGHTLTQPDDGILALALAWHVKRTQPLSPAWALRMARRHPSASRSVVAEKAPDQLQALFTRKYLERFGNGFVLRTARRDQNVEYHQPASPSLLSLRSRHMSFAGSVTIPNVLGLQSQFVPLVKLWDECIDDLKPLGRQLAQGVGANTRAAYEALPDELKAETEHPDKSKWDAIVVEHADDDGFVVAPMSKLAALQDVAERSKLTAKQSRAIAQAAERIGYSIEPDARLTKQNYSWDDFVALFRREGEDKTLFGHRYLGSAMILELGMAVAAADGVITEEESNQIGQHLEGQLLLERAEIRRLRQLERVFLKQHPSLTSVSRRLLKAMSPEQRRSLGRFLFDVAAASGAINDPTLRTLRRAFKALQLELSELDRLVDDMRPASESYDPSVHAKTGYTRPEEAVALNPEHLERIRLDTEAVRRMLGEIFQQEDGEGQADEMHAEVTCPSLMAIEQQEYFPGLDARFHSVVTDLLRQEEWSAIEFDNLIRSKGLMPADTIARINEWAEEALGDFVIEEGEPVRVQCHLMRVEG